MNRIRYALHPRRLIPASTLGIAAILVTATAAWAQGYGVEYLDTAGRWKALLVTNPGIEFRQPWSMASHAGIVVVGRDGGSILVSHDSAETFTELGGTQALPGGLIRTWALAFVDTLDDPDRIAGAASFDDSTTSIILSTDGGSTWRRGQEIPKLAGYDGDQSGPSSLYSDYRPEMQFRQRIDAPGTVGFLANDSGLWVSDDRGNTWDYRCDSIGFSLISMADATHGVAFSEFTAARPSGLHVTHDGGHTWRWARTLRTPNHWAFGLAALDSNIFRMLLPDMNDGPNRGHYSIVSSTDGGNLWAFETRIPPEGQGRIGDAEALYWFDTTQLHVIYSFGRVDYSTDGGRLWINVYPTQPRGSNRLVMSIDGKYIYYAANNSGGGGGMFGRWRYARVERQAAAVPGVAAGADVMIHPNPATTAIAVRIDRAKHGRIEIFDALGRQCHAAIIAEGAGVVHLDVSGLSPGAYFLRVETDGHSNTHPIVIRR